jgi:hypothetical protein
MKDKLKKAFAWIFLLGGLGILAYLFYLNYFGACKDPLKYSLGRFDTEFGVSKAEFLKRVGEGEEVWEKVTNKNLFQYEEGAKFKINLIFDERQRETIQKQRVESGLDAAEKNFRAIDSRFSSYKNTYEARISEYEADVAAFKKRQASYESQVDFWNSRGGAPQKEYEALSAEARYLKSEMERLNAEVPLINRMAGELNALLEERNQIASEYNKVASAYNKKYGHGLEFDQAEYTGDAINIYQFGNRKDLVLAMAHEFGHALGMDHGEDESSIMYYITGGNEDITFTPSEEDIAMLKKACPGVSIGKSAEGAGSK